MSEIAAGPWGGDPKVLRSTTPWNWKPSGPITGIDISSYADFIWTMTFKSNSVSETYGQLLSTNQCDSIDIKSGEYLIGISGAYASSAQNHYLTSLSFETNLGNIYGPYTGLPSRPMTRFSIFPFSYKTPQNSPITGFHGFSATISAVQRVSNIGVYVKLIPPPPKSFPPLIPAPPQPKPIFVNEWGGPEGKGWKLQPNGAISQIVIFHSSLMFNTEEDNEESEKFGGTNGGTKSTVDIKPGISVIGIKGTFGKTGCYNLVT